MTGIASVVFLAVFDQNGHLCITVRFYFQVLKEHLDASMKEAGREERELAIHNGDIDDDGVPFITVTVDGAWAKRSYGHNYNSLSGVVSY